MESLYQIRESRLGGDNYAKIQQIGGSIISKTWETEVCIQTAIYFMLNAWSSVICRLYELNYRELQYTEMCIVLDPRPILTHLQVDQTVFSGFLPSLVSQQTRDCKHFVDDSDVDVAEDLCCQPLPPNCVSSFAQLATILMEELNVTLC